MYIHVTLKFSISLKISNNSSKNIVFSRKILIFSISIISIAINWARIIINYNHKISINLIFLKRMEIESFFQDELFYINITSHLYFKLIEFVLFSYWWIFNYWFCRLLELFEYSWYHILIFHLILHCYHNYCQIFVIELLKISSFMNLIYL